MKTGNSPPPATSRWRRLSFSTFRIGALCAVWGACAELATLSADELPRYRFEAGQELVYRAVQPEVAAQGRRAPGRDVRFIINVIGQNRDGSWRLLFRRHQQRGRETDLSAGLFSLTDEGVPVGGRLPRGASLPLLNFPPLPPDEKSLRKGWSTRLASEPMRRLLKCKPGPLPSEGDWLFRERMVADYDAVYGITRHHQYTFDLQRGLVRRTDISTNQEWPRRAGKQTVAIELVAVRQADEEQLSGLVEELKRYFAAQDRYDDRIAQARRDFDHTAALLDRAAAELRQVASTLRQSDALALAENKLARHAVLRDLLVEDALRFGKLLDKPSANWETTDLNGQPHSLADYRGGVVVLDFWYRGCGPCIRAMPGLKQLVDDFAGQQVAVLGMNSDRNPDDARFVMQVAGLNYPTLKNGSNAEGINTQYGVRNWPTLVVLDRQGVVRHFHSGYSPTLREDLGQKVRELLAEEQ